MARQLEKKRALQGNVCAQRPIERAQRPNNLHCIEQPTMPRHERPPPRTRPAETRVLSTETSYGFRPGRGCKDALRRVDRLLKDGYTYVVDADLKSYFDTIPHDRLMDLVEQKISDGRVLKLIRMFLEQDVMEALRAGEDVLRNAADAAIEPDQQIR